MWRKSIKYYSIKFLRLRGTPVKIAIGFAVGAVVNFYPTFGFGVVIAGFLAGVLGGNITAGVVGDVIFKSFFPIFFYFDLLIGNKILGNPSHNLGSTIKKLIELEPKAFLYVGKAFFLGAVINSVILGIILFMIIRKLLKDYRTQMVRLLLNYYKGKK